MKNNYRKLKQRIFLQVLTVAAITGIVGTFIINIFVDGILQAPFADGFINFCERFLGINDVAAIEVYQLLFRNNKQVMLFILFVILLIIFFYFTMSRFTRYFDQINAGMEKLADEAGTAIVLAPELDFMQTELNDVKNTLAQRKKDMLASEERKNDLVVYLAHDLKTPLTSVIGYLSLLKEAPDMPEEQRLKYNDIAFNKALRLEELINEFFEITRFNLQNIKLEKEKVGLNLMLMQMADEFYPLLAAKNNRVIVKATEDIEIYADPDKLARVFNNILKNAVAYSFANSVIEISLKKQENQTVITFKNTGRPIPAHKLDSIFEKFYRVDEARSANSGGSGLGLAIAKEIVALHNGQIRAESNQNFTVFEVTLPL